MSLGLIIHAIVLAVAFLALAYVVFAAAQKSEGVLKPVGTVLAALVAAIGALVLTAHLTAPMFGGRPFGIEMGPGAVTVPATAGPSGAAPAGNGAKPAGGASESAGGDDAGGESTTAAPKS